MKLIAKSAVLLAIIATLISFVKFDYCRSNGWAPPADYIHACYSDFPALFGERGLITNSWPYSSASNAVEYPPITGVVMWATSFLVGDGENKFRNYFDINALLVALLFIGTVVFLKKLKPQLWYLLPIAPAVVASLYINWDIWAVISALAAIYYFDVGKFNKSAIALGLSIATKFFPIVLLLPITLIFFRKSKIRELIHYLAITTLTWLLINLPFIITTPTGWFRFFKLNSERAADWGSIWHALEIFGLKINQLNLVSIVAFALVALAFTLFVYGIPEVPKLASIAFFIVAIFVTASKVYSPQYILWLTPLAILAMVDKRDRFDFWTWQFAELIYHFAIWQYLAQVSGANFAIPAGAYAIAILLRVLALTWFSLRIMRRSTPKFGPQNLEFLSGVGQGYA
ncbi:unannotated protein [freshwater metagenome]|uniref:Unannotated protein n=1 Tax=freshwater metagenome TaxID=449393 RepID=A0A6J6S3W1_9ZZZZ